MGISCELLESDFLKCSVGFPFMRSKSKVRDTDGTVPRQQAPALPTSHGFRHCLPEVRSSPTPLPPIAAGAATEALPHSCRWQCTPGYTPEGLRLVVFLFDAHDVPQM